MQSGMMIIHGNHLEELRTLAIDVMKKHPLPPLASEVILVQSNGIAQWLKLAIAQDEKDGGCGIAAAINTQLPSRFLWNIYRTILGEEAVAKRSPLDKEPLKWRLLQLLPQCLNDPLFSPLSYFLSDDSADQRKYYQLAECLADLFDQYQVYRADWLQDWLDGNDQLKSIQGKAREVSKEHLWQPALWRLLAEKLGYEVMQGSRAGIHQLFIDHCQQLTSLPPNIPSRISIFGISSLPAQTIEALTILSRFVQVILYVHNPCQFYWLDIIEGKQLIRHEYRRQQKKSNHLSLQDLHHYGHPLLAAWGKQGRDYIALLDSYDTNNQQHNSPNDKQIDLYTSPNTDTLLGQLQDDILELRALPETQEHWSAIDIESDHSIRFHITHSPQREVEVLHDQLLDIFNQNPKITPNDIIVMVPDINKYAPFIKATFGQVSTSDPRYIPFTLSDRNQRGVEPLLVALEYLLNLPESRFKITDILDLFDIPAIRNRFNWKEEDLPLLHRWIHGAGIRWGLNETQRQDLKLTATTDQNSWLFGLQRMLLGYAIGNQQHAWSNIVPFDEVGGNDSVLVGSLAHFIAILDELYKKLSEHLLPSDWAILLKQLLNWLFEATNDNELKLLHHLSSSLDDWLTLCEEAELHDSLPLAIVREAWLSAVDTQGNLNQHFIAGAVNFCTLMPMRAIPFKVICLLGMNDGDYPRPTFSLDFDLMSKDYRPGDRSRREDDRYLLLEAVLSAREKLYISWVGKSIRDNTDRAPSILIGQLRDHLNRGWKFNDNRNLLDTITQVHALQPFSPRYFQNDNQWFSYANEWSNIYQQQPLPEVNDNLTPLKTDIELTLNELTGFLKNPVRYFFNQRLKVSFPQAQTVSEDHEPFSLQALDQYKLLNNLLDQCLLINDSKEHIEHFLNEQIALLNHSGQLPIAGFGTLLGNELINSLTPLLTQYRLLLQDYPLQAPPFPIHYTHLDTHIADWLTNIHQTEQGQQLYCQCFANKLMAGKEKATNKAYRWQHLIAPWLTHLIASYYQLPLSIIILATDCQLKLEPIAKEHAQQQLNTLIESWQTSLHTPIPVALKTAFAYLSKNNNLDEAEKVYEGTYQIQGERGQNPTLSRQYPDFNTLNKNNLFEEWAKTLYQPLYEASWQHIILDN